MHSTQYTDFACMARSWGRLRGGPFLCLPIEHFHGFDHHFRDRPLNLNRAIVRFDAVAIVFKTM